MVCQIEFDPQWTDLEFSLRKPPSIHQKPGNFGICCMQNNHILIKSQIEIEHNSILDLNFSDFPKRRLDMAWRSYYIKFSSIVPIEAFLHHLSCQLFATVVECRWIRHFLVLKSWICILLRWCQVSLKSISENLSLAWRGSIPGLGCLHWCQVFASTREDQEALPPLQPAHLVLPFKVWN